ncbi:MAG TPA: ribosome biogenesis GTP-binding protein YihA/YsxC [Alphaproteobacteria bacterium]|nr:ribosome biogenesis GTP-binding protein YihA/YsxC [Alphaproteobacteria bacterium]
MTAAPGNLSRTDAADATVRDAPDGEALEVGRLLFAKECTFLRGVVRLDGLPDPHLPEIAFAGRSNVGKSSLMNALTGRKTLARTSNTPGRTREINFFELGGALMLADLPGYGFAKAPKTQIKVWNRLVRDYLTGRPNLRRLCLLIDARRGIKDNDLEIMGLLDEAAVVYQVVFTKCDKVKAGTLAGRLDEAAAELKKHGAAYPTIVATSAIKGSGIAELRAGLAALAA